MNSVVQTQALVSVTPGVGGPSRNAVPPQAAASATRLPVPQFNPKVEKASSTAQLRLNCIWGSPLLFRLRSVTWELVVLIWASPNSPSGTSAPRYIVSLTLAVRLSVSRVLTYTVRQP